MTYQTLDWDAEAKRVALAFGIKRPCSFQTGSAPQSRVLVVQKKLFRNDAKLENGAIADVIYSPSELIFGMERRSRRKHESVAISLNWDGSVNADLQERDCHYLLPRDLAKALFHLDLLTPDVESALKVDIAAQTKVGWRLKYEFETTNWEAETLRISRAFEVVGKCEFRTKNPLIPNYSIEGHLRDGCFEVGYIQYGTSFTMYDQEGRIVVVLGLSRDGQVSDCQLVKDYSPLPLARALFRLDLLTPEVEAALGTVISSHEKLEWALEYDERIQL